MTQEKNTKMQAELKKIIKNSFDDMLSDVLKGKKSIQEFSKTIDYNYSQKKMELSGRLF
jgi:hypothetical protein